METFAFKKLKVWEKGMEFTKRNLEITESIKGHYRLVEQLESASASIPQNIAEGYGRLSVKETIHFMYIARASLYETITLLNIFAHTKLINEATLIEMEIFGLEISKMINSFITAKRKFL